MDTVETGSVAPRPAAGFRLRRPLIFGLSGAAIFLNAYKTPLLWLGIVMNLFGIAY
jgi:hypothetical protein